MTRHSPKILFYSVLFLAVGYRSFAASTPNHSVSLKTGAISYSTLGFDPKSGLNVQNFAFDWNFYLKTNFSIFAGYQSATDTKMARTLFQKTFTGLRYFPITTAIPIRESISTSFYTYDFFLRPYATAGGSFGRYLIGILGDPAIYEASTDFFGLFFGGGTYVKLWDNFFLDFNLTYESIIGYNSPLAFSASNISALVGIATYL